MLDNTFVAPKKETLDFKPLPEDIYTVELLDITPVTEESYNSKQDRAKDPSLKPVIETTLKFQFVLLEGRDGDTDLRGRSLFLNFVPSFLYISNKKGKNKLYQIVEAMQNKVVTQEQEAYGISGELLNSFVGKQCRVGTTNKASGDKTYSNIDKLLCVKTPETPLTAEEKEKAKVKHEEQEAEAVYDGTEITAEHVPFN